MKLKILVVTMLLSGCTAIKPPMYDYGTYAESFYGLKKNAGEESTKEWKAALEDIIVESDDQAIRVPPGVYANLGYLHLKENNAAQAISYFEKEKKTYPESGVFMKRLIKKSEALKVIDHEE